jgi:diacylglycerol kinase family enzyme
VKGLLGSNTALAIIPKGSGNGMARAMQIPLNEREAIQVINRGNTIMMDIGYANGEPFISNSGVAFDALIAEKFALSLRRGFSAYSWLVTKHMWLYNEREWLISIDGREIRETAFIINIANGSQFGYNFRIAPGASWTDGLLDIIIVRKFPKVFGAFMALRLLRGSTPTLTSSRSTETRIRRLHPFGSMCRQALKKLSCPDKPRILRFFLS